MNFKEVGTKNVLASFAICGRLICLCKKKRPQSVSGQRSLIEYGSNAKSLKKWMYAIHIGHIRKPKQLKKNTILQKEFNLPKKKEFVKNLYIRYEFLKNIM